MVRRILFFGLVIGSFLWATAGSLAFCARSVVVFPFENNSRNTTLDWIGESFVETLNEQLETSSLTPVSREQRNAAYDLLGLPIDGRFSRATLIKIGDELNAQYVALGAFQSDGTSLTAALQIINLETRRLEFEGEEKGPLDTLKKIQSRLAGRLLKYLDPASLVTQEDFDRRFADLPLSASENYVRGVQALDQKSQLRYFLKAERLFPGYLKAVFQIGKIYFQDKDYPTAVLWLRRIPKTDHNFFEATFYLGLAHFYTGHYEKSSAAFTVLSTELPLNEVYNNLGAALSRFGKLSQAIGNYQRAIDGDPEDSDYDFNLGYHYWKTSEHGAAVTFLQEALRLNPQDAEATYLLAQSYRSLKQPENAARYQQLAAKLNPKTAGWKADMLPPLERVKLNFDAASFRELKGALDVLAEEKINQLPLPDHIAFHMRRGIQLFNERQDANAADEFKQALSMKNDLSEAHLYLGRIHERQGNNELAVAQWRAVIHTPQAVEAHMALAHLYLTLDRRKEAAEELAAALILDPDNQKALEMRHVLEQSRPSGRN